MSDPNSELPGCWSQGGIGCVSLIAGTFSGGMVGVFISVMVREVTRGPTCEGIPTCDWHVYMLTGAVLGALSLPALVFRRIRRTDAGRNNNSDQG